MNQGVETIKQTVCRACEQFNVKRLELFGSAARGQSNPGSDLDFIVEFMDESPKGYAKRFFGFHRLLEQEFGRSVDLLTNDQIRNPYFKKSVNQDRVPVYG